MVCVLLSIFGVGLMILRPFLPPQAANRLQLEADEYLRQGANQQIDWHLLDEATFAEARRLERPIMLVMGAVGSRDARTADNHLFTDQDIQSYLSRNFICVRVDLDAQPYWENAFLPISRISIGVSPSFQLWYLDPQGNLFDFYGRRGFAPLNDPLLFLDEITGARRAYEELLARGPLSNLQDEDTAQFANAVAARPDVGRYLMHLRERINPQWGGFPSGETQSSRPNALKVLLLAGDLEAAEKATVPMLRSGLVDWLDGGIFRRARRQNWTDLEFDKLATSNSEAMRVLATYGVLLSDRFSQRIAKNTFDNLASDFSQQGFVATARIGDESAFGRSAKASFPAKDLRAFWGSGLLSPSEAVTARKLFGLSVDTNPQMNLRVTDPTSFDDPSFEPILGKLRKHKKSIKSKFSRTANAYVNGVVCAAMLSCARLWDDADRLRQAEERFATLSAFGEGDDITHNTIQRPTDNPYLGDYLAVSEACLQKFLVSGDVAVLERGSAILKRARSLFSGPNGWTPSIDRATELAPGTNLPQIFDGNQESLYARTIRLNNTFGRLMAGTGGAERQEDANQMVRRGSFLLSFGPAVASYVCACYEVLDDAHAITVGPGAVSLASKLYRLRPTRLVAPARGPVRPDLQKRDAGIYLVRGTAIDGPLSLDQAAERLDWRHSAAE